MTSNQPDPSDVGYTEKSTPGVKSSTPGDDAGGEGQGRVPPDRWPG